MNREEKTICVSREFCCFHEDTSRLHSYKIQRIEVFSNSIGIHLEDKASIILPVSASIEG